MGTQPGASGAEPVAVIYRHALPQVYGYLLARCGSTMVAEDLTAETFTAAVAAVRAGRVQATEVTVAWLVGVARHKLADHWRRSAREERGMAAVRYFVTDLDAAVAFYRDLLGFEEELRPSPVFAMLYRSDLRLLLSVPGRAGGGEVLPDGSVPAPGGWNRIALRVPDLDAAVAELRRRGARLRTGIIAGVAVRQVLLHDPAGNLVELFEPAVGYHERPPKTAS